jgi:hypothetical protein
VETAFSYLAQGIKDLVEVQQDLALCDLCNVVHALASVISNSSILVGEAGEDRWNDFFEITGYLLGVLVSNNCR